MQVNGENVSIIYSGASNCPGEAIVYARSIARQVPFGLTYAASIVAGDSTCNIRVRREPNGGYKFYINCDGCKDYKGFILSRVDSSHYYAYYNDATHERIDPPTGTPRPDPDPAVRTKGFVVPTILQDGVRLGDRIGSKYSGKMRRCVQCWLLKGKEPPFRYDWGITHGIISDGKKYWLAEISSGGVFIAPIKVGLRCCDSYDVSNIIPTAQELIDNPGWLIYKNPVNLQWAFSVGKAGVQRIATSADVAGVYALGDPFYADHGWAFNYSGSECQNVTHIYFTGGGDIYYKSSRIKLVFSFSAPDISGNVTVSVAPTIVENQKMLVMDWGGVWTPVGEYDYYCINGTYGTDNPIDAPMCVWYDLDVEQVCRYYRQTEGSTDTFSGNYLPGPSLVEPRIFFSSPLGDIVQGCRFNGNPGNIAHQDVAVYGNWQKKTQGAGRQDNMYTPKISARVRYAGTRLSTMTAVYGGQWESENTLGYEIHYPIASPPCTDESGTRGYPTATDTRLKTVSAYSGQDDYLYQGNTSGAVSCVIPQFEREAVCLLEASRDSGMWQSSKGEWATARVSQESILEGTATYGDGTAAPYGDWLLYSTTVRGYYPTGSGASPRATSTPDAPLTTGTFTGYLHVRGRVITEVLPVDGSFHASGAFAAVYTANYMMRNITLPLFVMGGGLSDKEPGVTPINQYGNLVYTFNGSDVFTGFETSILGTVLGFVGRV